MLFLDIIIITELYTNISIAHKAVFILAFFMKAVIFLIKSKKTQSLLDVLVIYWIYECGK